MPKVIIVGKRCSHRSSKACENNPDVGAKSVPCHIHRELKVEADVKIICADDRHLTLLHSDVNPTDPVLWIFYWIRVIVTWT